MSEKCPTCKGPVEKTGGDYVTKGYGTQKFMDKQPYAYRSTAAEQLAIEHENVLTLKDELANTLSNNDTLRQQLADKERGLDKLTKQLAATKATTGRQIKLDTTEIEKLEQELAAANAVVDDVLYELDELKTIGFASKATREKRERSLSHLRKLQGGDGE